MIHAIAFGSLGGPAVAVDAQHPLPIALALFASGKVVVAGSLVADGASAAVQPKAGRDFNVTISRGGGTVQAERSFDGGATSSVCIGDQMRQALPESFSLAESETGVLYRVNCTAPARAPIAYRVSQ